MKQIKKTETVAEFLAKGGSVKLLPSELGKVAPTRIPVQSKGGITSVITYEDCEMFYGEAPDDEERVETTSQASLRKELQQMKANFNNLPKVLKDKELIRLKAMVQAGEIEDNGYFEKD